MEREKGNDTGMVMLHLQKAFDTVDHGILLMKLKRVGLKSPAVNWFKSYLANRKQVCKVGEALSTIIEVTCGVPQGSMLGPLLFLIYVNDMLEAVTSKIMLYADDSTLLVSGKNTRVIQETVFTFGKDRVHFIWH